MTISNEDKDLMRQISAYYRSTKDNGNPEGSIRETALKFGLNRNKIRKILITSGELTSPITEKALELRKRGLSIKETARRLGVSSATVSIYLPYEDSIHNSLNPTKHALDIRTYRAYENARAQRISERKEEKRAGETATQKKMSVSFQKKEMNENKHLSSKIGEYTLSNGLMRIHASLEGVDQKASEILKQYGCVKHGNTITRDLIVPENMPLRALHFALQRAFGFQESHLHLFTISEDDLMAVTDNNMRNLLNLRGVIFTQMRKEGEMDYEPVYQGGSFRKWLRKQYTYPWNYDGDYLTEFHDLLYRYEDEDDDENNTEMITTVTPSDLHGAVKLGDMNIRDGLDAIEERPDWIIEGLPIQNVLAVSRDYLPYDEDGNKVHTTTKMSRPQLIKETDLYKAIERNRGILPKPFTDSLQYDYDFGDGWQFRITGSRGCSDLIEDGIITWKEMMNAVSKVLYERHPVLIAADGDMLIEDVGGVVGFVEFLERMKFEPGQKITPQTDPASLFEAGKKISRDFVTDRDAPVAHVVTNIKKSVNMEIYEEDDFEEKPDDRDPYRDENGMIKSDLLRWALGQGWTRSQSSNIDLL